MKQCTDAALYESLNYCQGKSILPGIRQKVYVARKSDIVKWPTLPDTAASAMNELATYTGNFEMAGDATFHSIQLTLNKGQIEWESQGEKPSRTFLIAAATGLIEVIGTFLGYFAVSISSAVLPFAFTLI